MILLLIAVVVISLIYLLSYKAGVYKNALGLRGISRIEELRVKESWEAVDEFVHIADTLKQWKRKRKSLADYVEDENHREDLLDDIYKLRDWISLEIRYEKTRQIEDQNQRFIDRREYFLSDTVPYEEGRLLSWEPHIDKEDSLRLRENKGHCILTYQNGAVTKLRLEMQESGIFSIGWKQAGEIGEEGEPIEKKVQIQRGQAVVLKLSQPKWSGTIYILNHTRNVFDRVPL